MENIYTTENGQDVTLVPYTHKVAKAQEETEKASGMESYRKAYEFVKTAIGDTKLLSEILGGKSFETVDLQEVELMYIKIVDIYKKKVTAYRNEQTAEVLEHFDGLAHVLNSVDNIKNLEVVK